MCDLEILFFVFARYLHFLRNSFIMKSHLEVFLKRTDICVITLSGFTKSLKIMLDLSRIVVVSLYSFHFKSFRNLEVLYVQYHFKIDFYSSGL